jgi:transposase
MAVEGGTTSRVFEAYVEKVLAPALCPGRIVVMDKLGAHRPKRRVRELIEARGCEILYLPSYSADLNPIEEAFWKVKHLLILFRFVDGIMKAWQRFSTPR